MPNIARERPSGNGRARRFLFTKCASGTGMRSARPGSASAFDGIVNGFFENIGISGPAKAGHYVLRTKPKPDATYHVGNVFRRCGRRARESDGSGGESAAAGF